MSNLDGILVVNKPGGMTSHDVVAIMRKKLGTKKIGHAGTLDPMATGVLVALVGRATKLFDRFLAYDKEYAATVTLGSRTDTGDAQGKPVEQKPYDHITEAQVSSLLPKYIGEQMQVPPMYSAVKHKGRRLYKLALKGREVERQPRKIVVYGLIMTRFELPCFDIILRCSKGTYVRQLAEDLSRDLGSAGHISSLVRQRVGPCSLQEAVELEHVTPDKVRPFADWLLRM